MRRRIGVLGFAHGHIHAYCRRWQCDLSQQVELVAGWDHDQQRLNDAARRHRFATCDSSEELLSRGEIDAIVIASETAFHADHVEAAAAAKNPVVLQKPIALSLGEADRIVNAVKRHRVPFTMAWQMRVDPENLKMKEIVESGAIGRILMARRRHCLMTHQMPGFDKSWHVVPKLNRGMWADDAAHAVDFLLWMFGEPETVTAEIDTLVNPKVPDDAGIAVYRYANGLFAEVVSSFTATAGENTTEILGDKGIIIQNFGDQPSAAAPKPDGAIALKWFSHGENAWHCSEFEPCSVQARRIAHLAGPLADFICGRRAPLATAEEGRTALRMLLASYVSSEEGRRIRISDLS